MDIDFVTLVSSKRLRMLACARGYREIWNKRRYEISYRDATVLNVIWLSPSMGCEIPNLGIGKLW